MTEVSLLPCPFCGSKAQHWPFGGDYKNEYINCSNCDVRIGSAISWPAKDVIKQWNTRDQSKVLIDIETAEPIACFLKHGIYGDGEKLDQAQQALSTAIQSTRGK